MQYALVISNTISQIGSLPQVWWDGTRWWDFRGAPVATLAAAGWLPVVEVPRPAETATTTTDLTHAMMAGKPTQVWTSREKTAAEKDADARLSDHEARLKALEARVFGLEPTPPAGSEPTFAALVAKQNNAIFEGQRFLWSDGKVYVANLTLASTATPATYPQGYRLLNPPVAPAWSGNSVAYKVGDLVTFEGKTYKCISAHTSQAGWTPSAVPALWALT